MTGAFILLFILFAIGLTMLYGAIDGLTDLVIEYIKQNEKFMSWLETYVVEDYEIKEDE